MLAKEYHQKRTPRQVHWLDYLQFPVCREELQRGVLDLLKLTLKYSFYSITFWFFGHNSAPRQFWGAPLGGFFAMSLPDLSKPNFKKSNRRKTSKIRTTTFEKLGKNVYRTISVIFSDMLVSLCAAVTRLLRLGKARGAGMWSVPHGFETGISRRRQGPREYTKYRKNIGNRQKAQVGKKCRTNIRKLEEIQLYRCISFNFLITFPYFSYLGFLPVSYIFRIFRVFPGSLSVPRHPVSTMARITKQGQ